MDIHPSANLSRVYFANILCLSRLSPDGRTEIGVRVASGDTGAPTHSFIHLVQTYRYV
ncbi:hypothetical protein DFH29DRAFT_970914 [Suillus ampliporus]|nr:hypothetical protein DFH29DRAFT_970914 [Suillus ampliporus]